MLNPTVRVQHPGELIKKALEEHGLSVSSAAKILGINRAHLNNIASGKTGLSREWAYKIDAVIQMVQRPDERDTEGKLARLLLEKQLAFDWEKDTPHREEIMKIMSDQIKKVSPEH